jgi:hypothetical protein
MTSAGASSAMKCPLDTLRALLARSSREWDDRSGPASMNDFATARWYTVRRAGSTKPATYRCPLCGQRFPALAEHVLVLPEGDPARRRHAHMRCVQGARQAGRLPFRDELEPRAPSWLSRLRRRLMK